MTYDCCSLPIMEVDAVTEKDVEIQELRRQRDLLLQENAELREKQRWIPVTERLPVDYKDVIILIPYENHPEIDCYVSVGYFYPKCELWWRNDNHICKPTHWMPLPPKPGVKE